MIFRVRRIDFDASGRRLDAIELELEVNLPRMHSRPEEQGRPDLLALLDELPVLVATFDRDGRLRYLNRTGRRLLQREVAEGEWILSDFYSDGECERLLKSSLPHAARFGSFRGEAELVSAKGDRLAVVQDLIVHPAEDGTFESFAIVARPLEPVSSVPRPGTSTTWLGFLHDLNNLLSPIIAYSSLLELHVPDASPGKRYVHQIQRAAERMRDLSNQAARGLRAATTERKEVSLSVIVQEVASWLGDEYPRHRFDLDTSHSAGRIPGDSIALQEVVMNLLRNAVESLPEDGGTVSIGVEEPESGVVRLTIRDDGCGIPAAALERIFEPFFSTKPKGSGLGLALTREIVSRHNGTIEIETTPGAGTTVRVDFRF
jgi:nitrogen fixation/metabolism regulation signal transduction histidine kinase